MAAGYAVLALMRLASWAQLRRYVVWSGPRDVGYMDVRTSGA